MMVDLNALIDQASIGTYLFEARGINDSGLIIANGANYHAYLLTPVPEPSTGVLLALGFWAWHTLKLGRRTTASRLRQRARRQTAVAPNHYLPCA
jgi:hypothetical protein